MITTSPVQVESLLATKRSEWTAMLLRQDPHLQQPLERALAILAKRGVTLLKPPNQYCVRGNPHDYTVNLVEKRCSCGNSMCEHFLAAWFSFSQDELVHEQRVANDTPLMDKPEHGIWQGTDQHLCADGFCAEIMYGYGEDIHCARCGEPYIREYDETL